MKLLDGKLIPDRVASNLEGQIYHALRDEILCGRLAPGERLPVTRPMARAMGVAHSTIVLAFERLHSEGYVGAVQGSGTRVSQLGTSPPLGHLRERAATCRVPDESALDDAMRDIAGRERTRIPDLAHRKRGCDLTDRTIGQKHLDLLRRLAGGLEFLMPSIARPSDIPSLY